MISDLGTVDNVFNGFLLLFLPLGLLLFSSLSRLIASIFLSIKEVLVSTGFGVVVLDMTPF